MGELIALGIITFIGAIFFPIFTLGCVLIHFNHEFLGTIIIIFSILKDDKKK